MNTRIIPHHQALSNGDSLKLLETWSTRLNTANLSHASLSGMTGRGLDIKIRHALDEQLIRGRWKRDEIPNAFGFFSFIIREFKQLTSFANKEQLFLGGQVSKQELYLTDAVRNPETLGMTPKHLLPLSLYPLIKEYGINSLILPSSLTANADIPLHNLQLFLGIQSPPITHSSKSIIKLNIPEATLTLIKQGQEMNLYNKVCQELGVQQGLTLAKS